MRKIGLVILTYMNFKDTIECVDSLLLQENVDFQAVLVDNCSPNEAFEVVAEKYAAEPRIDVIQTTGNLGYAKGNNVGIVYLKEKYGIHNMLILNNDTVFTDKNYLAFFAQYPIGEKVGAVGTRIIGQDRLNQNPRYDATDLKRVVKDSIYFTLDSFGIIKYYQKLKGKVSGQKAQSAGAGAEVPFDSSREYFLHGSALFLTENFLNYSNGFYPDTFLYYEENILAIMMQKMNLKMVYDPSVEIYHKEDQSSAISFNNVKETFTKYLAQSIRIALKVKLTNIEKILKHINSVEYHRKESESVK